MRNGNAITGGLAALPFSLALWALIGAVPILGIGLLLGVGWIAWEVRQAMVEKA